MIERLRRLVRLPDQVEGLRESVLAVRDLAESIRFHVIERATAMREGPPPFVSVLVQALQLVPGETRARGLNPFPPGDPHPVEYRSVWFWQRQNDLEPTTFGKAGYIVDDALELTMQATLPMADIRIVIFADLARVQVEYVRLGNDTLSFDPDCSYARATSAAPGTLLNVRVRRR